MVGCDAAFETAYRELRVGRILLDRLLLETDSPYLAPVPFRGKRNDSRYLPYVAERIAAIKGICAEEAERITWENALRFFALEGTR